MPVWRPIQVSRYHVGPGQVYRLTGTAYTPTPVRRLTLSLLGIRRCIASCFVYHRKLAQVEVRPAVLSQIVKPRAPCSTITLYILNAYGKYITVPPPKTQKKILSYTLHDKFFFFSFTMKTKYLN